MSGTKQAKISEYADTTAQQLSDAFDIPKKRILEIAIQRLDEAAKSGEITIKSLAVLSEKRPSYGNHKDGE